MPILYNAKPVSKLLQTREVNGVGEVLEVRLWPDSTLIEVDLHLPAVDMQVWTEVMQITFFSVSKGHSCNVVPFGWDAETSTCSVIIDSIRDSACSGWARRLRRLDRVEYTNISAYSENLPFSNLIVAISDGSNLGFLLALQQLSVAAYRLESLAWIGLPQVANLFYEYFNTPTITVTNQKDLLDWLLTQQYCSSHTSFYLGGDSRFNSDISRFLKAMNYQDVHAFSF